MLTCINKNLPEYQALKNKSGVQEAVLDAICRYYLQEYNRFPFLDELPDVNSEPFLRKQLSLNQYSSSSIKSILESTNSNTIEDAVLNLNDEYRDLEIEITPIKEDAIVDVEHKPNIKTYTYPHIEVDDNVDERQVFNNALKKLANLYGINFIPITNVELSSKEWVNVPNVSQANAFIYNGDIYINIDKNSVDAPLHEIMHILVGSMRFSNPKIYQQIVDSIEQIPNFEMLASKYPNRTKNDVKEEIFVTEIAKFVIGEESILSNIPSNMLYEIMYNAKRLLDGILMGENSVGSVSTNRLFNMSLKELAKEMNSTIMTNNFTGTINIKGSELHRKLNNIKADLIKNNQLKEYCE